MTGILNEHNRPHKLHHKSRLLGKKVFNIFLFIAPSAIAIIVFSIFLNFYSFPHTYVSNIDMSLKTRNQIANFVDQQLLKTVKIQIKDRTYIYTPSQIGIGYNRKLLIDDVFKNNHGFLTNIFFFIKSLNTTRSLKPFITISDLFDGWFDKTVFDFSKQQDEITFDPSVKEVKLIPHTEKYKINSQGLKEEIFQQLTSLQNKVITPTLIKIEENSMADTIKMLNETYQKVINDPITIYVDPNAPSAKIILDTNELKQIFNTTLVGESLKFATNKELLKSMVINKFSSFPQYEEKEINVEKINSDILALANLRMKGMESTTITTTTKPKTNTNGDVANKYIEIDLSQQQMFIWEAGRVIATHMVSTGLYYPTPPGKYKILNKSTNAFSYIYNVYMPYWMAFYMAPDIHAFLGIHELPYWIAGSGNIIRRPRDFLGSPHTGGCVSLDVGVAEKVYAWADIGTPVVIFR